MVTYFCLIIAIRSPLASRNMEDIGRLPANQVRSYAVGARFSDTVHLLFTDRFTDESLQVGAGIHDRLLGHPKSAEWAATVMFPVGMSAS
jgi:hypothetical protein